MAGIKVWGNWYENQEGVWFEGICRTSSCFPAKVEAVGGKEGGKITGRSGGRWFGSLD